MYTVTLIRGPKADVYFTNDSERTARQRAMALARLHGASYTQDEDGNCVVDATSYYGG